MAESSLFTMKRPRSSPSRSRRSRGSMTLQCGDLLRGDRRREPHLSPWRRALGSGRAHVRYAVDASRQSGVRRRGNDDPLDWRRRSADRHSGLRGNGRGRHDGRRRENTRRPTGRGDRECRKPTGCNWPIWSCCIPTQHKLQGSSSRQYGGSLFEQTTLLLFETMVSMLAAGDAATGFASLAKRHANLE